MALATKKKANNQLTTKIEGNLLVTRLGGVLHSLSRVPDHPVELARKLGNAVPKGTKVPPIPKKAPGQAASGFGRLQRAEVPQAPKKKVDVGTRSDSNGAALKAGANLPAKALRASTKVTPNHITSKEPSFAHLLPAPHEVEDDATASSANAKAIAAAVHAAANKARSPLRSDAPAPTGLAAGILAAGQKARSPTNAPLPPANSFAGKVIQAGKKRRGEI
jgi:hypothetical protein